MAVTYKKEYSGSGYFVILRYDASAGTYSGNYAGSNNFDLFADDATVDEALYFGASSSNIRPFDRIKFYIGTAQAGTGITITPEYWNGSAWVTIVDYVDNTIGFTATGEKTFYFDPQKQTGWKPGTVGAYTTVLFIRFRISALTTITEGGRQTTQLVFGQNDRIYIENYSSSTPSNADDIYNADKAGEFDLMVRTGITTYEYEADAKNPTYNLRPADEVTLGGTSNNLYVTAYNWVDVSWAIVWVKGTYQGGAEALEMFIFYGAGTQYFETQFRTVTKTWVNGFSGTGSFDYKITQGQWGITWKNEKIYRFDRAFWFLNNYHTDIGKVYYLYAKAMQFGNGTNIIYASESSFITWGTLYNASLKTTRYGINFFVDNKAESQYYQMWEGGSSAWVRYYNCSFDAGYYVDGTHSMRAPDVNNKGHVYNCFFRGSIQCGLYGTNGFIDIFNVISVHNTTGLRRATADTTVERITAILDGGNAVWFQTSYGTARGVYARGVAYVVRMEGVAADTISYLIDCDVNTWAVQWAGTLNSGTLVYRRYTIDFQVLDLNNAAISGATVVLKDKNNTQIFSVSTAADGTITQQEANRSYCNINNSNLDTTPTVDYSPHTLTISKAGYKTYSIKFTLSEKIDWRIKLELENINVDNETL